jgi:hypothetical protein
MCDAWKTKTSPFLSFVGVDLLLRVSMKQTRLRAGNVGDADEMRGYTSVLSLLRLITLQLSNLGAQLDNWHDTMYVPHAMKIPERSICQRTCTIFLPVPSP